MAPDNEQQQEHKQPVVIHLAQVKKDLTPTERRVLAEKLADALLSNSA